MKFNPNGTMQQAAMAECAFVGSLDSGASNPQTPDDYGSTWHRDHIGLWRTHSDGRLEFVSAKGRTGRPTKRQIKNKLTMDGIHKQMVRRFAESYDSLIVEALKNA